MTSREGLSEAAAARLLAETGPNDLPRARRRRLADIAAETFREPMFLLLLAAAGLYLVLGDLAEGLFLVAAAGAAIGLVVLQEARSERALEALREIGQPQARVVRGGVARRIAARELVPGDVLLIGEGDRLPADGVLVAGEVLNVDESVLTGESAPVSRAPGEGATLLAGSLVVRGQGVVEVTRTGAASAIGRISHSLAGIEHGRTPLQESAGRLVAVLGVLAIGFCVLVALAYGTLRHDWVGGALAGVTVAISLVPEEFPMVLAVFLAVGAWRLATHRVLVRRSAVIETLGGATVLCVDKTGTLTENRMQVTRVWAAGRDLAVDGKAPEPEASEVLQLAALASAVRPVDPMDRAIHQLTRDGEAAESAAEPERAWPLTPELMAVIQLWRGEDGEPVAAAKGAPEAIFRLCRLPPEDQAPLLAAVHAYAEQGLRVLGVASARGEGLIVDQPHAGPFAFAGLIGFLDPVRADVAAALAEANGAGIAVVMLTGDHPATARAIAEAAGIDVSAGVLTGAEVAALPFKQLREAMKSVRVFARIAPEQKLAIVEALKADGQVVAMTGDGVNDAPALEAAHIGIAMGRRGADVAREAADLVLLDDSFASIIGGVRLGRRIFANLRRALTYVTAIHIPIAGVALIPILMGLPPLLFPMHVVILELAIDPISALVFEAEPSEARAMRQPPRARGELLFGPRQLLLAGFQGAGVLAGVFSLYVWALGAYPEAAARGGAFTALVVGNLVLALADSLASRRLFARSHATYWLIVGAIAAVLTVVLVWPPAESLFGVATPDGPLLALALATALVSGGWGLALPQRWLWRGGGRGQAA